MLPIRLVMACLLYTSFENAETAWTSWDDKLDSENLTQIADEQQKLAQGITTPDEQMCIRDRY